MAEISASRTKALVLNLRVMNETSLTVLHKMILGFVSRSDFFFCATQFHRHIDLIAAALQNIYICQWDKSWGRRKYFRVLNRLNGSFLVSREMD